MKKQILSLAMAASVALALAFNPTQLAMAHADLESAIPAPGSTVTESPKQLTLVFGEKLQEGSSVELLDAKGNKVAVGDPQIDPSDPNGATLLVDVPTALSAGKFTVNWKSLSEDGHSEEGSYNFTLDLPNVTGVVTLNFALKAGKDAVACGKEIKGLGSKKTTGQIMDARLYVTNVRLIGTDGKAVPVMLKADGKWQSDKAALLDFEDATGLCKDSGTAETRTLIEGSAPAGKYTGVAFDLGLPFEINHADVATAKAPLNVQALWWNWQSGYKFARIDLATNSPAPNDKFYIHLGSTGCGMAMDKAPTPAAGKAMTETQKMDMSAMNKPPSMPCKNGNLVSVTLTKFDPSKNTIVADLAGLLTNVNVAQSKPMPAGCMSGVDDPDCKPLFPNFGLVLATGQCLADCRNQKLFRVE